MAVVSVPNNFTNNTNADAEQVDANFTSIVTFVNTEVIQRDGSLAFTAIPTLPASNPTLDNQATRKAYVDLGHNPARVMATKVATQSIPFNTLTVATFLTEDYDTNAIHDLGVNPGRLTIPAGLGGVWQVGYQIYWPGPGTVSAGRSIESFVSIDGVTTVRYGWNTRVQGATAAEVATIGGSSSIVAAAGSWVEVWVYHVTDAGAARDIGSASSSFTSRFWAYRVGPSS